MSRSDVPRAGAAVAADRRRGRLGTGTLPNQRPQPDQVVRPHDEGQEPIHPLPSAMSQFPEEPHGLAPPKRLFDPFPQALTDRVARVPGRPPIDPTLAMRHLGDMRRKAQGPRRGDELGLIVASVRTDGGGARPRAARGGQRLQHLLRLGIASLVVVVGWL